MQVGVQPPVWRCAVCPDSSEAGENKLVRGCRPGLYHRGSNSRWTRRLTMTEELNFGHVLTPAKWYCYDSMDLLLLHRCGALATGVVEFALTEGWREIVT